MPYYKFKQTDILHNQIKAHPQRKFFAHNSRLFLDNQSQISGTNTWNVPIVAPGNVSLYELNVDRQLTNLIYPFIIKDNNLVSFTTVTTSSFNADYSYGDTITGSYPMSSSIVRELFPYSTTRSASANRISALRNTLDYYSNISQHYSYSSSHGDKSFQSVNLISIPSIFYGSSIQKGTVNLKYYITGTLIGELKDENYNGELVQVGPYGSTGSGSVAGVVLYNEGFFVLTGSWQIGTRKLDYKNTATAITSSWLYYGVGMNDGIPEDNDATATTRLSASYDMHFSGTTYVPTVTMLANAPRGELNYSSNPSYVDQSLNTAFVYQTSSIAYNENSKQSVKNTVSSSYVSPTGSYKPQTFITKVGIYDENKVLIAIANLATPVKKTEERELTFRLKLDF
jgi:hypothetical protein